MGIPRLRTVQHNHPHPDSVRTTYDAQDLDDSVRFWIDSMPGSVALAIAYDCPGKEHNAPIFVPVADARDLAEAILAAIPD